MTAWLLWVSLAIAAAEPTDHTLVYYNARLALREDQPVEAVKLWLLRNALESATGEVSAHDDDFHSVTWAALGEVGLCQDGYPTDDEGAGLWPLALHNWVVKSMGRRGAVRRPRTWSAFELQRQQRHVSLIDVLTAEELRAVRLFRGPCLRYRTVAVQEGLSPILDISERQDAAVLLRHLLVRARTTLAKDQIRGLATIEARLFDIDLQLTALAAREAKRKARERARQGGALGLSRGSIAEMTARAPSTTLPPEYEAAGILRASVHWPVSEWMLLEPERRLFLFDQARAQGGDPASMARTAIGIVDRQIAAGEGEDLERWIARCTEGEDASDRASVWGGERGARLLALERDTGFRERAVIALHRGVHDLERGDLAGAMRAIAFSMQHASDSRAADTVQNLGRRWLSYVASQYETSDELLVTLQELVPRREYGIILEDLMWHAAFRADEASYLRGVRNQVGRGALERRLVTLSPLASGELGRFTDGVAEGLERSPSETLRFLKQLVQRLELEDAQVRTAQLQTLARLSTLLEPLASHAGASGRRGRTATDLLVRIQAIREGLVGLEPGAGPRDHARSLAPTGEVFAGSVRLAPVDPLPWPFRAKEVTAPSVFTPLDLTPVEWRNDTGEVVFGWSVGG